MVAEVSVTILVSLCGTQRSGAEDLVTRGFCIGLILWCSDCHKQCRCVTVSIPTVLGGNP